MTTPSNPITPIVQNAPNPRSLGERGRALGSCHAAPLSRSRGARRSAGFAVACSAAVSAVLSLSGCTNPPEPGPAPPSPEVAAQLVEGQLAAAKAASAGGDYAKAMELFREILAENPTVADAYLGIGGIYEREGKLEDAEPAYARAARLEPRNFDAQISHGRVLAALKRYLEAIRAYHRALSIQPESFGANLGMAETYLLLGDPNGALAFAEKAVAIEKGNGAARLAFGNALLGVGRNGEAIEQFETALELTEPTPELLLALVKAYGEEKRYEEAANTALVLVRLAPSANAYERLGWTNFRLGKYGESIAAYRDAVRIDDTNWPALNGIGVNALNTWLLSGRSDATAAAEAREAFRRSLRMNPNQPKVVRLLTTYQL